MTSNGIDRRRIIKTAGAAAVAGIAGPYVGRAAAQAGKFAGKQIRVLTWSDATGQAAVRNIMQTFEKATGAKVIADLTGTTSEMVAKIKASANRPQYDVVILSGPGAVELAKAGVLTKPDEAKIPNLAQVGASYRLGADGHAVGYFLWSDGLVYNPKAYPTAPKSYKALWDGANKQKIFVPPANNLMALELVMIASRIATGDYRNADAAFKLLGDLKAQVLTITSNANQLAELFRSSALNAGGVYSPLELSDFIPKPEYNVSGTYDLEEGFFVDLQFMVVPKGHPGDADVAYAFINHALDAAVQGKMAEDVWYGPINEKAVLSERAKASPFIPSPEVVKSRVVKVDPEFLAGVRSDWTKRYTQALSS